MAQQAVVYGYISDSATNEKLPGVNIVADSIHGVATDVFGHYILHLPDVIYKLTYTFLGFQPQHVPVLLKKHDSIRVDVKLKNKSVMLDMA